MEGETRRRGDTGKRQDKRERREGREREREKRGNTFHLAPRILEPLDSSTLKAVDHEF